MLQPTGDGRRILHFGWYQCSNEVLQVDDSMPGASPEGA